MFSVTWDFGLVVSLVITDLVTVFIKILEEKIDKNHLPQHVAIIMDGNGRWAKARGLERYMGHQEGVVSVRKVVEAASDLGIKYLTMYTFSTENWNRP